MPIIINGGSYSAGGWWAKHLQNAEKNERVSIIEFAHLGAENIPDAYSDSRFDQRVDKRTGYHTRNILCMPIVSKTGARIGVTQVLNKKGSAPFSAKDESRLQAFTAQVAVSLENAQLFDFELAPADLAELDSVGRL